MHLFRRALPRLLPLSAALFGLALAAPALAADYWVDGAAAGASDANDGSEGSPWSTIQHAADVVAPGDTVHVRAGDYPERVRLNTAGTETSPIAFVAEPRREVRMAGFTLNAAHYNRVEGFDIKADLPDLAWDETDGVFINADHVEVLDNYLHEFGGTAIGGYWHEPFPVAAHVAGNDVYRIQMGITVSGSDWLVEDNEIVRLVMFGEGDCDYLRFFGTGHVIRRNVMYGTDFSEIGDAHVDCFQTFTNNGEVVQDILFDANVCHDFHQGLMASNEGQTDTRDFTFTNNVFAHGGAWGLCVHDVSGIRAYHNTFYDIAYHGAGFRDFSTGNDLRNNIFAFVGSSYWASDGGEVTGDYNLTFEASAPDPAGANDLLSVDPLFVDMEGDDVRLQPESPAVDSGETLPDVTHDNVGTTRPEGAGVDRGAFEYTTSPPLSIVTTSLPEASVQQSYQAALVASGGTPPYGWRIVDGALPGGLALEATSGTIAGTPDDFGEGHFTVEVEDSVSATASRDLTIVVRGTMVEELTGDDGGCGCRLGGARSRAPVHSSAAALLALAATLARARRRRRFDSHASSPHRTRARAAMCSAATVVATAPWR